MQQGPPGALVQPDDRVLSVEGSTQPQSRCLGVESPVEVPQQSAHGGMESVAEEEGPDAE